MRDHDKNTNDNIASELKSKTNIHKITFKKKKKEKIEGKKERKRRKNWKERKTAVEAYLILHFHMLKRLKKVGKKPWNLIWRQGPMLPLIFWSFFKRKIFLRKIFQRRK